MTKLEFAYQTIAKIEQNIKDMEFQRNDPALIAEIVEKTLAYVIAIDQDDTLLTLSPDIVNQILNEKL